MTATSVEGGLVIRDDIGWVSSGEGQLRTATVTEYVAEIEALRQALGGALEFLKGRMPCPAGKCCEDIRARIAALEALTDDLETPR